MDPSALPEQLQPHRLRRPLAATYPITRINPVTGYATSIIRQGDVANFLGWLTLLNGTDVAGYIVFTPNPQVPELGDTGYVAMYFGGDVLEPLFEDPAQRRKASGALHATRREHAADGLPRTLPVESA